MIIDDFLRYMETERVASPLTVKTYRDAINNFSEFVSSLDGQSLETADADVVRDWISGLMEQGHKATYVCKQLSAVKSMYRYALKAKLVDKDPAHLVTGPKKQKPLPMFLKESEAERLFDGLEWDMDNFNDVRTRTLLLLLYSTGIRRAEAVGMNDSDVNFVNSEIKVTGKRRKQRLIPMTDELAKALGDEEAVLCICAMDKEYSKGFHHIRYDRNSSLGEGDDNCMYRLKYDPFKK